jgi:hypothetical protein
MFTITDKDLLLKLRRVVAPNGEEMETIFSLYKKYINENARQYTTGCSCGHDIGTYYWDLMDFFSKNESKFINA